MAMIGTWQIGKAVDEDGAYHYSYVVKPILPAPGTGDRWIDTNQASGVPKYNAFPGSALEATQLIGSGNNGIYTGNVIPETSKFLARAGCFYTNAAVPAYALLCDYLLFYPLIDCDDDTLQELSNPVGLPRYSSGVGVQMTMISTVPAVANATCTVTYTNSDGVSGRVTTFSYIQPAAAGVVGCSNGTSASVGSYTPFIPLVNGDKGVQSVQSVQFATAAGGFATICLVKPLAQMTAYENSVYSERTYGVEFMQLPEILPGAYLNFLIKQLSTVSAGFRAELLFIQT